MKPLPFTSAAVLPLALAIPAAADVVYSNLRDIDIPATYDGVYLNIGAGTWNTDMFNPVAGWDINPFDGGASVANSPSFQPVRIDTDSLSAIVNLSMGSSVGGSSVFASPLNGSPAYGGSETHLGEGAGQFAAGSEGYLGFRMDGDTYGWMRVLFTDNTGGAHIRDWAYETGGGPIAVGRIEQSAALGGAQSLTLSPGAGESFTLGSQISDTGGNINSLLKTGEGTSILTGEHSYTGVTTVSSGTLVITGNISTSSATTVQSGGTLAGTGTVGSASILEGGILAPGNSAGTLDFSGNLALDGLCDFEIDALTGTADLASVTGNITFGGVLTLTNLAGTPTSGQVFNLFDWTGSASGAFSQVNLPEPEAGGTWDQSALYTTGTLTVIPEPSALLLLALTPLATWHRRRP